MELQSLVERLFHFAMGGYATLMAIRLSLIPNVDLATKWMMAVIAILGLLSILLHRWNRGSI